MKMLLVCQHFYPENFKINDIAQELVKRGNKVTVLTGLPNYPEGKVLKKYRWFKNRKENINGVKVIRCSLIGRGKNNVTIAINYVSFAINSCIKAIFMKKDFDVVLVYQLSPISMAWPGIIVSKMKKIPLIIYSLDLWPASMLIGGIKKGTWQYNFFYKMSRNTYNKSNNIFVSSKGYIDYFKKELKLKNKNYTYIPNYLEEDCYLKANKSNDVFNIVFAGNIGPAQDVKSIVFLAKDLQKNTNIFFHIVGDGLSKKECEELSNSYHLNNIKFYGKHEIKEMKYFYSLADAFIITMKDNEVVNKCEPAKLCSYMSVGKPIIGMISGVVNQIINENKCGIAVNSSEYKKLSKEIIKIYKNKSLLKIYGKNSREYYKNHYDKRKNIDLLIKSIILAKKKEI